MTTARAELGPDFLRRAVCRWADSFEMHKEELCRLDAQAGDGDHGLTIARGFSSARVAIEKLPESASLSDLFKAIGLALMQTMGGASGPIFATLFLQAGYLSKDETTLTVPLLTSVLRKTGSELEKLTGVQFGDKTMYDVLFRLNEEAIKCAAEDVSVEQTLSRLHAAAERAVEETKGFVARKGRARFLGERSQGFIDAGAMSTSIIFKEMYNTLQ